MEGVQAEVWPEEVPGGYKQGAWCLGEQGGRVPLWAGWAGQEGGRGGCIWRELTAGAASHLSGPRQGWGNGEGRLRQSKAERVERTSLAHGSSEMSK